MDAIEKLHPLFLRYSLSYDEIYETFATILNKHSRRSRHVAATVLSAVAVVLLVLYARNPSHLEYSFLALVTALLIFRVLGYKELKARRSAKRLSRVGGIYEVTLYAQGQIQPKGGAKLDLNGDKDARAFETERLFVIRPDRMHTFAIPKRAIRPEESAIIRNTLKSCMRKFSVTFV